MLVVAYHLLQLPQWNDGISHTPARCGNISIRDYCGAEHYIFICIRKGEEAEKKWHNVKFEAKFTSNLPHFVVDTDSDRKALARALAREKWTKEFFEVLEK